MVTHQAGNPPPHVEETAAATTRYLQALTILNDAEMRAPSLLPGWTRAHVVAHLARNADGLVRLLTSARTGADVAMYDSQERRDSEIDSSSEGTAEELRADAAESERRYRDALEAMTAGAWQARVRRVPGADPFPVSGVPGMRRGEIEVHHADLGVGYTAADWPPDFSDMMIGRIQNDRADGPSMVLRSTDSDGLWKFGQGPGPDVSGTAADLAWWVLGRGDGSGLVSSTGEVPYLGKWR
jgi:maleylpyruvate isomerase